MTIEIKGYKNKKIEEGSWREKTWITIIIW